MLEDSNHGHFIAQSDKVHSNSRSGTVLVWSNISVECCQKISLLDKIRKKTQKPPPAILTGLSGIARPGELLAVMGTSGVGKTTLLNFLSGQDDPRVTIGKGDVLFNGHLTNRKQRQNGSIIGHVQQHEPFLDFMTLEEHLIFQAMLRMQKSIKDADRRASVSNMVKLLSLERSRTTIITRLSGGERKRLTFATVLLSDPEIVLIDEPTSGLDLYLAKMVMRMIRAMAKEQQRTVIVVLHQATSEMFEYIDTLCLLVHGGTQAFFGPREAAVDFFSSEIRMLGNSLEQYIEQLATTEGTEEKQLEKSSLAADCFKKSNHAKLLDDEIHTWQQHPFSRIQCLDSQEWTSSVGRQMKWLLWRTAINFKRNPKRTIKVAIRLLFMALLYGILLFQINVRDRAYQKNINAVIFLMVSALLESNISILIITMINELPVVIRDYKKRMYSLPAYYIIRIITDAISGIIIGVIYMTIITFLVGLNRPFLMILIAILVLMSVLGMGSLIAVSASSTKMALILLHPLYLTIVQFSGYYMNSNSMPIYVKWLQYFSFFYYYFHAILVAQWYKVPCAAYSILSLKTFASKNTTDYNPVCEYTGDDILRYYGADPNDFDFYIIALLVITFTLQIMGFLVLLSRLRFV